MSALPSLLSILNRGPPFHFLRGPTENPLKAYTAAAKSSSITACLASQSFTKLAIFLAQKRLPVAGCHNDRSRARAPLITSCDLPRPRPRTCRDDKNKSHRQQAKLSGSSVPALIQLHPQWWLNYNTEKY